MKTNPIRAYRGDHHLRLTDVADRLAISIPHLHKLETEKATITAEMAVHIERKLGIPRHKLRRDLWS